MAKKKVLIIDDDTSLCGILEDFLSDQGYRVMSAHRGLTGFKKAKEEQPHLIVLDVDLPDLDGYDVCRRIRKVSYLQNTPVVMLTARSGEPEEVKGFESGADDFISKPFKPKGLLARIETAIGRSTKQLDANALTHLPGNQAIFKEIEERIEANEKFSVFYMDLNHFKSFNDRYGFIRGDEAIKLTSTVLSECFEDETLEKPFLGHVGGDDFVGLVNGHKVENLCQRIVEKFDGAIVKLYDEEDRKKGHISTTDRKGNRVELPIMGLAIAVITNKLKSFTHPGEVALSAGDLKRIVKSQDQSWYVIDRRS
jgi:diguanylate cyclase (GGDEF)-like protein